MLAEFVQRNGGVGFDNKVIVRIGLRYPRTILANYYTFLCDGDHQRKFLRDGDQRQGMIIGTKRIVRWYEKHPPTTLFPKHSVTTMPR